MFIYKPKKKKKSSFQFLETHWWLTGIERSWVDDGENIRVVLCGALEAREDRLHVHQCPCTLVCACHLHSHAVRGLYL